MKSQPLVSIIIPIYNVSGFLKECLDSILGQTYSRLEIILVDDGSTDDSGLICDEYQCLDSRIKVIHKSNGGLSDARNAGLEIMTGSYVAFVDSDDWVHPRYVEILLTNLVNTSAEVSVATFRVVDEYSSVIPEIDLSSPVEVFTSREAVSTTLYQHKLDNSAWGKLYSSRLFDSLRFKKGIGYEDLQLFYRIYERAEKVVWQKVSLYFYRRHDNSYLNRFTLRRTDVLDVTDELEEYMRNNHPYLLKPAQSRRLSANFNILWLMTVNKVVEPSIEARCWSNIRALRRGALSDKRVRCKNKIGILLSYLGKRALVVVFGLFPKQPDI